VQYRHVGQSGLVVSVLALGCRPLGTRLDAMASTRLVHGALDAGVTLFDTADVYGQGASEEALGRALAGRRDAAVIATKFRWLPGAGRRDTGAGLIHVRTAVEASLRRLRTDRIDLYQIHAPDPGTPIEETLTALDQLAASGKILYAGSSNFAGWQLVDADWVARFHGRRRLVSTQAPYSLLQMDAEQNLLPAARHCGVGFLACLVLARGHLAAPRGTADLTKVPVRERQYGKPAALSRRAILERFAADHQIGLAAAGVATIAGRPGVSSVIVGASSVEHVLANAAALETQIPGGALSQLLADIRNVDADT
jgi:aryl-alcohol dehydrogenase-like predicted oxidoreductase